MLGQQFQSVYDQYVNTVGNLTLTAYNASLSNDDFPTKKTIYATSNVTLNKYFMPLTEWTKTEIVQRGNNLAAHAAQIWKRY